MANYCEYEVRVRGSRNACLMVYASMPTAGFKALEREMPDGGAHFASFTGECAWSVNFGVKDAMGRVDIEAMSQAEIERCGGDYANCSLRAKSEALQCEIMVHYWSEESLFDQFDHYKNGEVLKRRKIAYNIEDDEPTEFDWDSLEFVGHEGEYDESVDGEESDARFVAKLMSSKTIRVFSSTNPLFRKH